MRAIQLGLIDAGSCTRSLSVLLLAAEISVRDSLTLTLTLEIAQKHQQQLSVHAFVHRKYQPRLLFEGGVYILLGAPDCPSTIRGWGLIKEIW